VATGSDTSISVAQWFATEINTVLGLDCTAVPAPPLRLEIRSVSQAVKLEPWIGTMEGFTLNSGYMNISEARQRNFTEFLKDSVLTTPREDVSFAYMYNPLFYEKNTLFQGGINHATLNSTWGVGQNDSVVDPGNWRYNFVPFVRVRYILTKIAVAIGLPEIEGDFAEFVELMDDLILYNNYALDDEVREWQFKVSTAEVFERYMNVHATSITLSNHVDDITAREFLRDFCETFNLTWREKQGRLLFSQKDQMLKQVSDLISEKIVPLSIERKFKKREGLILKHTADDKDAAVPIEQNYTEGAGKTEITLPTGILAEITTRGGRLCCYAEQKGSSKAKINEGSVLRFMFDRGVQSISGGAYIQSATSSGGSLSLIPSALFAWAWREHARLKASGFPVSFQINASINDIFMMKLWETALYRIHTPDGAAVVAVNTIDVSIDDMGLKETKITGYGRY
jgi:hypothetical protein